MDDFNTSGATAVLQDALGVTPAGNCIRHPNCPVLSMAQNKVVSCRICFTEEKSVGILQRKNFAAVVNQLQTKVTIPDDDTSAGSGKTDRWADDEGRRKAHQASMQSVLLYQSKQAQTLDAIMKRISQVQNWTLRQKEKEVLSLKLQIQSLESKLDDAEVTVVEQTQTIRALRRSIQSDLQIIKTMASSQDTQDNQRFNNSKSDMSNGSQSILTMSPLSTNSTSPRKTVSPPKLQNNRLQRQMDHLKRLNKSEDGDDASVMMGMKNYQRARPMESTIPLPGSVGSASPLANSIHTPVDKAANYWNGAETPSGDKMNFRSSRGGLLDHPKSPPPARHNKQPSRQKLTLESFEKDALKMPSMRNMRRRSSGGSCEPLGMLTGLALSPTSDVSGHSRTLTFDTKKGPVVPSLSLPDSPNSGSKEGKTKPETLDKENSEESPEKYCFSVTGADCNDKYGEGGRYTGSLHALENLPYGQGQMSYDSGRIYSGNWKMGSWHGVGTLLNPNGDRYEGEFCLDSRHGQGTYYWANGDVYTGHFVQDKRCGQGKFSFHNGNVYEGQFADGMFEGFGRYKFDGGYFEGEWKQGKYDGQGELKLANGVTYKGEFKNSLAHGFGTETMLNGKVRRGVWENGEPMEKS